MQTPLPLPLSNNMIRCFFSVGRSAIRHAPMLPPGAAPSDQIKDSFRAIVPCLHLKFMYALLYSLNWPGTYHIAQAIKEISSCSFSGLVFSAPGIELRASNVIGITIFPASCLLWVFIVSSTGYANNSSSGTAGTELPGVVKMMTGRRKNNRKKEKMREMRRDKGG